MNVKHFLRVSTKKQADKGDSIEFQDKRLIEHSKLNNDKVVEIIKDAGISASISDDKVSYKYNKGHILIDIDITKRTGMCERVMEDLDSSNWEVLKVTKWDRFSRDAVVSKAIQKILHQADKSVVAIDDSSDPLVMQLTGVLSEEEIRKMKLRVRDVRQMRFNNGMMVARPPLGYKLNKIKKTIEIDTPKAKVIQKVFQMASEGDDYKTICAICDLAPQQVYNILRNKTYMGIITFEGIEKSGTHEPLVTKEIWEKANGL